MLMKKAPIVGVWDDHDYGNNNGDASFLMKAVNREIYLDFINEPLNTVRRNETNRGIYQDYIINHDNIKIHVVLLDVRFHFNGDEDNDRLGILQHKWLREIFKTHSDSDITLIGSGIQMIPERWGSMLEDFG
jgi:alkaline phosphatase D